MKILALESSTTSAKAMLYDTDSCKFEVRTKAYDFPRSSGIGQQDSDIIFDTTIELGRNLVGDEKGVGAVALACTWHSVMLCDRQMKPATPLLQWTFTGASEICQQLREDEEYSLAYYHKTGCMVNATYPMFKLMLLRKQGYNLEDYLVADQGCYTNFRLTGQYLITDVTVSGGGMLNTHKRDYDDELNAQLGITREHLPRLVRYDTSHPLSSEGAQLLGLSPGIPVMVPMPDGALNHIGSGALPPGVMTFSMGTSAAMRLSTPEPVIPAQPSTWCYIGPKAWLSGAAAAGCTNCVDWVKGLAFGQGTDYSEIEKWLGSTQDAPIFLPFLFGERCPGWRDGRMGGFLDLHPGHTAHDMYSSVLEGVLFNLYQSYRELIKLNERPHTIKLSGGIQNSPYWIQMCADIFESPMELDPAAQASLMGAVVVAMEKLGLIGDLLERPFPAGRVVLPNPKNFGSYKERFERYLYFYDRC